MKWISFIFCLFILIVISCGIDEIPVLSRPQFKTNNEIDDYFEFKATEDNDEDEFRGFEVYYKFFSADAEGESAANYQSNYTSVSEVEAAGFRRITYYIDSDDCDKPTRILKPLIKVPLGMRGTATTLTINFGEAIGKGPTYSISSDEEDYISISALPIRRGIEDTENQGYYKGFDTYKKTDIDVYGLGSIDPAKKVNILVYVLSYGIYNLSEQIYSDALCLGYIELQDLNLEE
ncbi:MAG: hypothetical protein JXB88_13060 [Spirochaetales bacterium]|nr:hypothetical protein [Spirochaetales bacterium]